MSKESVPISVKILDKDFRISCPADEREALEYSARYLDEKMRELRSSGNVIGIDRISVMAALNIVHELLQVKSSNNDLTRLVNKRVDSMQNKVDIALSQSKQLEL